ncbi:CACTA en-spm transposon protein [Cucumis melo var. makuwa]|uniref:CACTA en-spm transposon protein n=1 Tax=Cucumis melo var. makuwa TaxID=1194695 RepID=A0A5A7UL60_CUCMM|nr:CACTA en-spm transposon protein [Cucumis melo var. makuwa]TYK24103.1 CACTA en-spm transposon protein [Cucumis melo var. makuwa]
MFLEFVKALDNPTGGSLSVADYSGTSQPSATSTPKRRAQSQLLELERYITTNGQILMTIVPGVEKPIFPYDVRFNQAIGVCVRKTSPVHFLKWADVGREYIEIVKANLQMLKTFKEVRYDYHRHFKKYSDPEEARANLSHLLVGRDEDWHYLCDYYMSYAFQVSN